MDEPEYVLATVVAAETAQTPLVASRRKRSVLFALLAIGLGLLDLAYYPLVFLLGGGPFFVLNAVVGAAISLQVGLIAIGTALGPGRMIVRLPTACLMLMGAYVLLNTGRVLCWSYGVLQDIGALTAANLLLGWLTATIAVFAFRSVTRLRLAFGDEVVSTSSKFHLQHLIIGTALAGVTLALFKVYGLPGGSEYLLNATLIFHWCVALVQNQTVLLLAIAAAFLWHGSWGVRLLKLIGIGIAIAVVKIVLYLAIEGSSRPISFTLYPLLSGVSQCVWLMVVLSLIRSVGYELRLVDGVESGAGDEKSVTVEADPWSEDD